MKYSDQSERFINGSYIRKKYRNDKYIDQILPDGTELHYDKGRDIDVILLPSGLKICRFSVNNDGQGRSESQVEFHYPDKHKPIEIRAPDGRYLQITPN